ncbi:methionine ABC transporter ATP-binding protein [Zhaonella formicivorans]|uniref:methionine ABC transporter ATP-binding protein n=1 Tax=Zhaonella formicivorans TaxID=2528593 RepID=UPI0010E1DCB7|nr:methionine ABC transporter ATP-binding protein [Zhaonella formicivorans]
MIEIAGLKKIYGKGKGSVLALDGIDLKIKQGEIFGIIGLSGAGKSTLIRCLNMLERPTEGKVIVDGQDMTSLSASELRLARRNIGMIFQHFNLLWSRTVAENVAFPLEIAGIKDRAKINAKVTQLLELVGLSDKANAYPSQLSGGQKQRVGIARALANDPKVLLCDEATSALDPQTTESILKLLRSINQQLKLTIVIITHEMSVIKSICDSVAVIADGKIAETGPVLELFTNPRTATAREFVKSIINTEIPEVVTKRQNGEKANSQLIRISFIGDSAGEPVISNLVQTFNIKANILYGNIDHIKDTIFGTLTVQLAGQPGNTAQAISYLKQQGLKVEVLTND